MQQLFKLRSLSKNRDRVEPEEPLTVDNIDLTEYSRKELEGIYIALQKKTL